MPSNTNRGRRATQVRRQGLRLCRCGVGFDPLDRDVRGWPVIENENASDYCKACWLALARTRGRPLGQPTAPPGLTEQQIQELH